MNLGTTVQLRGLEADWTKFDEERGKGATKEAAEAMLRKNGFTQDGRKVGPEEPSFWVKHVYQSTDRAGGESSASSGHRVHSVAVYPDGHFEHTSEGSNTGHSMDDLGSLMRSVNAPV